MHLGAPQGAGRPGKRTSPCAGHGGGESQIFERPPHAILEGDGRQCHVQAWGKLKDSNNNYYLKEWKDRRNKALGFAADVADGMDKKKSMVVEMFGLETDEEVGIMKIPDMISIPSNGGSGSSSSSSSSSYNGGRKPLAILARR